MRHSPLQTECHFAMPISAIARCNLHLPDYNPIEYLWKKTKQRATHNNPTTSFDFSLYMPACIGHDDLSICLICNVPSCCESHLITLIERWQPRRSIGAM